LLKSVGLGAHVVGLDDQLRWNTQNMADFVLVRRYSVSKAPIYAGLAFMLFWLLMLLFTIKGPFGSVLLSLVIGFPK
jgi:hypothetical protein